MRAIKYKESADNYEYFDVFYLQSPTLIFKWSRFYTIIVILIKLIFVIIVVLGEIYTMTYLTLFLFILYGFNFIFQNVYCEKHILNTIS